MFHIVTHLYRIELVNKRNQKMTLCVTIFIPGLPENLCVYKKKNFKWIVLITQVKSVTSLRKVLNWEGLFQKLIRVVRPSEIK